MNEKKSTPRNPEEPRFHQPTNEGSEPLFESSDLFLCSFLKAKGLPFEGAKRGEGKRVIFVFQRQSDLEDLLKSFYNDGLVPVLSFKSALRNLRDLIFGETRR